MVSNPWQRPLLGHCLEFYTRVLWILLPTLEVTSRGSLAQQGPDGLNGPDGPGGLGGPGGSGG